MSKEILTTQLCFGLHKDKLTPAEVGILYADILNNYINSHVQVVGAYVGTIPPAIPEFGVGNFAVISTISPWEWPEDGLFSTWITNLSAELKTKIMISPISVNSPIVITAPSQCFTNAEVILTPEMIAEGYKKNVTPGGELLTSGEQIQYDCQFIIASAIIDALMIGFTIVPYSSTMVGSGLTTLIGTLVL
jgi:hypothetical protein